MLQILIYYLCLKLAVEREGSGNNIEISNDSLFQGIGTHHGSEQKAKKQARVSASMFLNAESKVGPLPSYFLCEASKQAGMS